MKIFEKSIRGSNGISTTTLAILTGTAFKMEHQLPPLDHETLPATNQAYQDMLSERKQSVPETPFAFATPIMPTHEQELQITQAVNPAETAFNPAFGQQMEQPDYYRRMSLPAHLVNGQIPQLVNYSELQSNLINSFNPYMFQNQFEADSSPIVNSISIEGMTMFNAPNNVNMYYEGSRAPTPFFDMSGSIGTTPIQSPVIQHNQIHVQQQQHQHQHQQPQLQHPLQHPLQQHQEVVPASAESSFSSPPQSPQRGRRPSSDNDKKNRFKATEAELPILSAVFEKNPFPSAVLRQKLADRLGLEPKQIQFWFQNRRATLKINGIHVVKPRKSSTPSASSKQKPALAPLTAGNSYFFVEADAQHNFQQEV